MISITRKLQFCAGHRVYGHEGKCNNLHGHNYEVIITASAENLDSCGRVIDFSAIKTTVGKWIEHYLDHGMILWTQDPLCALYDGRREGAILSGHKHFFLEQNPTAENIALFLLGLSAELLKGTGVQVLMVGVEETPNCSAHVSF
jgi:6-pyruvoyltetrahydropterin/6-carboxytetrahydropterin synthase